MNESERQFECEKCYEVLNGFEECITHMKENKHHSFKLRGTDFSLSLG